MRNTQENIAKVKVGSVIQISPEASETVVGRGGFAIVHIKETWGCIVSVPMPATGVGVLWPTARVVWNDMEIIGQAVWDIEGKRLAAVEPLRHHP